VSRVRCGVVWVWGVKWFAEGGNPEEKAAIPSVWKLKKILNTLENLVLLKK